MKFGLRESWCLWLRLFELLFNEMLFLHFFLFWPLEKVYASSKAMGTKFTLFLFPELFYLIKEKNGLSTISLRKSRDKYNNYLLLCIVSKQVLD